MAYTRMSQTLWILFLVSQFLSLLGIFGICYMVSILCFNWLSTYVTIIGRTTPNTQNILIISPYAKRVYIDHTEYQFESILKFMEWRFNIPSLTNWGLHANNLLNAFAFNQNADSRQSEEPSLPMGKDRDFNARSSYRHWRYTLSQREKRSYRSDKNVGK